MSDAPFGANRQQSQQGSAPPEAATGALPAQGATVGERYQLGRQIGSGGMGVVFSATDQHAHRDVAIKIMKPRAAGDPSAVRRFAREVRAAREIRSDHVVEILDVGELGDGTPFLVMERLEGEPLDRLMAQRGPLPVDVAVDWLLQACEGLAAAHARGIVHRDLKLSNLFWNEQRDGTGVVKVLDFGIAKATTPSDDTTAGASLTGTDAFLGSPEYMSPEQIRSAKHVDHLSDIWSLGLILYRLLTARGPFEGDDLADRLTKAVSAPPTPLRRWRGELPAELEEIVLCCLSKDPLRRYPSVAELAGALEPFGPQRSAERLQRIHAVSLGPEHTDPSGAEPDLDEDTLDEAVVGSAAELRLPALSAHQTPGSQPLAEPGLPTLSDQQPPSSQPLAERRPRRPPWMAAAVIGALGVLGLLLWRVAAQSGSGAGTLTPALDSSQRPTAGVEATRSGMITIVLDLEPAHAMVRVDGQQVSGTSLQLPRSDAPHELTAEAAGCQPLRRSFIANEDQTLQIALDRMAATSTEAPSAAFAGGRRPGPGATRPRPPKAPTPSATASTEFQGPMEPTL